MLVQSSVLGEIEVDSDKVVRFTHGMPGFEEVRSYVLLQPDPNLPFNYLQSVEHPNVVFLLTDPFIFVRDYDVQLSEEVLNDLMIQNEQEVQVWAIVTLKESIQAATMNLLAPIVVNLRERLGRQIILANAGYSTKHPLMPSNNTITPITAQDGA